MKRKEHEEIVSLVADRDHGAVSSSGRAGGRHDQADRIPLCG